MRLLHGIIPRLWRRDRASVTPVPTSKERDRVSRDGIFNRACAELSRLTEDDMHPRLALLRATSEFARLHERLGPQPEDALIARFLERLPARDLQMFRHRQQGKQLTENAALMGADVETVRRSLAKTYFDLRMLIKESPNPDGDGEPAEITERIAPRMVG